MPDIKIARGIQRHPQVFYIFSPLLPQESHGEETERVVAGRILFMMSTFDRGHSTHHFKGRDKLDFVSIRVLRCMSFSRSFCLTCFLSFLLLSCAQAIACIMPL